jgi:hypothetical protein
VPRAPERELVAEAERTLETDFHLLSEAWLRDPLTSVDLRIDLLAWPKIENFPFDLMGVEVKRPVRQNRDYVAALKQCVDYRRAVVVDDRCQHCFGWMLAAVFLFCGRESHDTVHHDGVYGAARLAGRFNVGELVRHPWTGARLEIAETPIWSLQGGVTGMGVAWPAERRVGNGRRRSA